MLSAFQFSKVLIPGRLQLIIILCISGPTEAGQAENRQVIAGTWVGDGDADGLWKAIFVAMVHRKCIKMR